MFIVLFIISEFNNKDTKLNGEVTIKENYEEDYANENSPKTIKYKSRVGDEVCIFILIRVLLFQL